MRYDPLTGELSGSRRRKDGYYSVKIKGQVYLAHRLIWLIQTGSWPQDEIDHIDGDPSNNRWNNLREATHGQNQANSGLYKNNTTGFKGVSPTYYPPGKYRARIRTNGVEVFLGTFDTAEEAHKAYVEAAEYAHGEFARTE